MIFKKLALQLEMRKQAKTAVGYVTSKESWRFSSRYEASPEEDRKYLNMYDYMLGELTALRMTDYIRYRRIFVDYLTHHDPIRREAAKDLLDNEFEKDRVMFHKLLILK
jgi:hypothetical protein